MNGIKIRINQTKINTELILTMQKKYLQITTEKHHPDLRQNYGEDRWVTIGKILDIIIVVVYTIRDTAYRMISARYAKKKERKFYNNQ